MKKMDELERSIEEIEDEMENGPKSRFKDNNLDNNILEEVTVSNLQYNFIDFIFFKRVFGEKFIVFSYFISVILGSVSLYLFMGKTFSWFWGVMIVVVFNLLLRIFTEISISTIRQHKILSRMMRKK